MVVAGFSREYVPGLPVPLQRGHIERWNGSCWLPVDGFGSRNVGAAALQVYQGKLFVGGGFSRVGDRASYSIARWEGDLGIAIDPPAVLTAKSLDEAILLEWTQPATTHYNGIQIRYSPSSNPTRPTDGQPVPNENEGRFEGYPGEQAFFYHEGLVPGETYYYSAFAYEDSCFSSPAFARASAIDSRPPRLTIGVFQNPYLTRHLDIYISASESLDSSSLRLAVGDSALSVTLSDPENNVWNGDYEMVGPGGTLAIACCASDLAGNDSCVSAEITMAPVGAANGGVVLSPDGGLALRIGEHGLDRDTDVIVQRLDNELDRDEHAIEASAQDFRVYRVSAGNAILREEAALEISFERASLNAAEMSRLVIVQAGRGELPTLVSTGTRGAVARITSFGEFHLALSAGENNGVIDSQFLDVHQNVPNPFNPSTAVHFEIRDQQRVTARIFDVSGREVARLLDAVLAPGSHLIEWHGQADNGIAVSSGTYVLRVETSHQTKDVKLVLIR
jgi:hypothetical protein